MYNYETSAPKNVKPPVVIWEAIKGDVKYRIAVIYTEQGGHCVFEKCTNRGALGEPCWVNISNTDSREPFPWQILPELVISLSKNSEILKP